MIFSVAEIIAWVSKFWTLKPGDIILTGTPPGTGGFRTPPVYLKHGDAIEMTIENLGTLRNDVVDETRK